MNVDEMQQPGENHLESNGVSNDVIETNQQQNGDEDDDDVDNGVDMTNKDNDDDENAEWIHHHHHQDDDDEEEDKLETEIATVDNDNVNKDEAPQNTEEQLNETKEDEAESIVANGTSVSRNGSDDVVVVVDDDDKDNEPPSPHLNDEDDNKEEKDEDASCSSELIDTVASHDEPAQDDSDRNEGNVTADIQEKDDVTIDDESDTMGQHDFQAGIVVGDEEAPFPTRSSANDDDGGGGVIQYRDHYSLPYPSSTVRFRPSTTSHHVYHGNRSQFVLEEKNNSVTVKRTRDTTGGVMFLRAVYTIVCVLWTGFLFVFCTQLLIFLIMNLAVYCGGTTGSTFSAGRVIGTILSLPLYVYGLASALIIAGHFVADTWAGQHLLKTLVFSGVDSVLTAWISFGFFLGFPLLVMGICLCAQVADWWSITAILWFSCVSFFYVLFAAVVIFFEIKACLEIVGNEYGIRHDKRALLKKCVLLRQKRTYSGETTRIYLTRGQLSYSYPNYAARPTEASTSIHHRYSLYSRLTESSFLNRIGMFKHYEEPVRLWPVEAAQGVRPFVTYNTWSLEKLYCKPRHSWFVAVITGPAALTKAQMQSSFACALLGNLLTWFLVVAFLVWFESSGWVIALIVVVLVLISIPTIRTTLIIFNMTKDLIGMKSNDVEGPIDEQELESPETPNETGDSCSVHSSEFGLDATGDSSTGVFQVVETYRITQASDRFCWVMFGAEIGLLFLWPLVSLYVTDDKAIGTVFIFIGILSLLRYYINAAVVLEEVGNMHYLEGKDSLSKWKNRSRTDDIVKNISRSRSRGPWYLVLTFFIIVALALGIGGVSQSDPQEGDEGYNMTFIPAFRYERDENSLPYPTCSLDFNTGGSVALIDFAFLSVMAYEANTTKVQEQLDSWFGTGVAYDTPDAVSGFRERTNRELSPVTYKLFSFPNASSNGETFGVVSIRGSQNSWDWLTNAQLWSAAYGMQILRSFLIFGNIWNPVYDELVKAISIIESESIERVSYYKETSDFVRWLQQESGTYADIKMTGHSLGGGLTIISAAQTSISGVAFSGPNAMMLRKALDPPITEEALDTFTFNVIPDRDMVPTAGGVAKLYQNIQCRADPNKPFECHDILRTLCEILFTCGTGSRPALCQCVTYYGFPEPISSNGESFADVCGI